MSILPLNEGEGDEQSETLMAFDEKFSLQQGKVRRNTRKLRVESRPHSHLISSASLFHLDIFSCDARGSPSNRDLKFRNGL